MGLLCLLAGCSPKMYSIGMSEKDFLKQNRGAELVQANAQQNVYRITRVVATWNPGVKFYYFTNGELTRIDLGVRQPDVLIQNTHQ